LNLDQIIGQKSLINQLKIIVASSNSGHAYAFSGPSGTGKRTIALAYARSLLCAGCSPGHACLPCRTFTEGTNPDFYEIVTDKQSIGVDSIRAMQEDMANRPTYGDRKVYFIDRAQQMTTQAQNCLLKTLEEPPAYAVILMSVANFDALLPTIRSRTVNFRINPYSDAEMLQILQPLYALDETEWEFILKFSRGIPGNAIHLIEEGSVRDLRRLVFKLLEKPDDIQSAEEVRKTLSENKAELPTVLDILLSFYRDCLMALEGMENRLINSDKKDIIKWIAKKYTKRKLLDKTNALEGLRRSFETNVNHQLGVDVLVMEIQEV
jgi:DNA polymerase-3 subunit delta'